MLLALFVVCATVVVECFVRISPRPGGGVTFLSAKLLSASGIGPTVRCVMRHWTGLDDDCTMMV